MDILLQCLEAVEAWMGNRLQLTPGKTKWLWVDPSIFRSLSSWSWMGHNLGDILDSQLLLKKQVAAMARKAFAQLHVMCQVTLS